MFIDGLDDNILRRGFIIPKFTDSIKIILNGKGEFFYRFILLVFYLLGCFQTRFYQYKYFSLYNYGIEIARCAAFHPIIWNPISLVAEIIFQNINYLYGKWIIYIEVSDMITIDVNNNQAYIMHIEK